MDPVPEGFVFRGRILEGEYDPDDDSHGNVEYLRPVRFRDYLRLRGAAPFNSAGKLDVACSLEQHPWVADWEQDYNEDERHKVQVLAQEFKQETYTAYNQNTDRDKFALKKLEHAFEGLKLQKDIKRAQTQAAVHAANTVNLLAQAEEYKTAIAKKTLEMQMELQVWGMVEEAML